MDISRTCPPPPTPLLWLTCGRIANDGEVWILRPFSLSVPIGKVEREPDVEVGISY